MGSSRSSRSGSPESARASEARVSSPPENVSSGRSRSSSRNPSPRRIDAARASIRSAYERRLRELDAPFTVDPRLLDAFEAEKAVYEFVYAARYLPSWLDVPRRALASVVS